MFSDEQLLVLKYEEFVSDPAAVLRRSWRFLGLQPIHVSSIQRANVSVGKRVPKGRLREFLVTDLYSRGLKRYLPRGFRRAAKSVLVPRGQTEFDDSLSAGLEASLRKELDEKAQLFRALCERDATLV